MTQKNLSPFGQAAVELDQGFLELEELGGQLERLDFDTEAGLERARSLLVKFSACGQRVGEGLQTMATTLNEARGRAEKTAELVSKRAAEIQERQKETARLLARFQALGEAFKKTSSEIVALQKPAGGGALGPTERAKLIEHLPQLDAELATLTTDAGQLREEARGAHMKALERNADALAQSLGAMRSRIGSLIESHPTLH